jgi:TonB-linked SusC/RagA family outer membrane protein
VAATLFALVSGVSIAQAQGGATIQGTVTNPQGLPVEAASVVITSLNAGAITTVKGTYTIQVDQANITGQPVSIIARRIGFSPVTKQITLSAGQQTVDFTLKEDVRRLDEVVVTGVAKATSMKNTAISITHLSADQIQQVPAPDVVSALAGKVAGVRVQTTTGVPGQSATIRLRGSTSLQVGDSDPLFLIDGVISHNGLAGIDPQDIVSIEVLKGAASATTYGSEAANGVVAITTNRGQTLAEGQLRVTARSELGRTGIEHWVPLNHSHEYKLDADGSIAVGDDGNRIIDDDDIMDNPYPTTGEHRWRNQLQTWLQPNTTNDNYVSLGYRRAGTNFFGSATQSTNAGVMPFLKGFRRQTIRFNLDQQVTDKFDISGSMMYGKTEDDQDGARGTGTFFALMQAPPDVDLQHPGGSGDTLDFDPVIPDPYGSSDRGNPLWGLVSSSNSNEDTRLFGSFTARYNPFGWLSFDASYGMDYANRYDNGYTPRGTLDDNGRVTQGDLNYSTSKNTSTNGTVNATFSYGLAALSATTRLTYLYEETDNHGFNASGGTLNVNATKTLEAADQGDLGVGSSITQSRAQNYYLTQNLNYNDRYIASVVLRRDGSSRFGADNRWANYFRVGAAWRVTQDFNIPGFQELKLRGAIGTAGLQPGTSWQYETYNLSNGHLSKSQLGNKNLRPAQSRESEFAIDASFLNRFDAEFSKSDRHTTDAFLQVPLSAAFNGGFNSQWQNAATIGARTWELSLTTRVVEHPDFSYQFTLTGDRTRQKIDKLGRPPFPVNAGGQGQGVFYYRGGESLGVIYGKQWATSVSQLLDNPSNAGMSLADLQAIYSVNNDGYVVKTADIGTSDERAIAYVDKDGVDKHIIGDVNPDFNFGWANTLRYKGFTLYALVDGSQGGDIYNFSKQWMFQDERHGDMDQAGKADADKHAVEYYTVGFYNGLDPDSYFVEDGSYVKLREVSVSYQLNKSLLNKIGLGRFAQSVKLALIGRNLKTWTDYSGFDPEVANGDFNFRIDGFRYPAFREFS